jgi:hypothetical protein
VSAEDKSRTKTGSVTNGVLRQLLGIPKLDHVRNPSVRDKLCVQNIVVEIVQYEQKWQQHLERMDTNRHCNTNRKGRETQVDRRIDGNINVTLMVKEKTLCPIFQSS